MTPGTVYPFQATSRILWRPRDHLPEQDVGRKGFLDPEVGSERVPYRPHAPVAGRSLPGEAARHPEAGLGLISWHSTYTSDLNTDCSAVRGVMWTNPQITDEGVHKIV